MHNFDGLLVLFVPAFAIAFLLGYLIGSVPFGLVFSRMAGLGDVRAIGSGNIGATNVLRTGRKDIAALTLLFDMLKGTAAVLIVKIFLSYSISSDPSANDQTFPLLLIMTSATGAFIGHLFPIWLKFKGGKGVATYIGILLGFSWIFFLVFAASWLATAFATRFSSIAAITASVITPIVIFFMNETELAILLGAMSVLLIWKHRDNIRRLLRGEESKIKLS